MASLNVNPNRKRYTKQQIETRRMGVWEMYICGTPVHEMATHYAVSQKTIKRDLDWWEERLGYDTKRLKEPEHAAVDIGMTAAKLRKVSEDAYVEYTVNGNGAQKVRFQQVCVQALVARTKILQETGYLPKVGHERDEAASIKVSFEARFGKDAPQAVFDDPRKRRRVLQAAYAMLKSGIMDEAGVGIVGEMVDPRGLLGVESEPEGEPGA